MNKTETPPVGIGSTQVNLTNSALYGRGWNEVEEFGCWSANHFSEIQLSIAPEVSHLEIDFSFILLEGMPRPQVFRLWVDRTCLISEIIQGGIEKHFSTNVARHLFADNLLRIKFYLSFLRTDDNHIPLSGDPRRLGLKLFELVTVGR